MLSDEPETPKGETMILETVTGGPIQTNGYLLGDETTGTALVIDAPQGTTRDFVRIARDHGLRIVRLVNTHGHWDHIADNALLQEATGAPIAVHRLDADMLRRPGSLLFQLDIIILPTEPDLLLEDGMTLTLGPLVLQVLHTPGHTPGSICLYLAAEKILFSGDTLFPGGHGRTDLPGASDEAMRRSLVRLRALPPDVTVYPGHGPSTTIGAERWLQLIRA